MTPEGLVPVWQYAWSLDPGLHVFARLATFVADRVTRMEVPANYRYCCLGEMGRSKWANVGIGMIGAPLHRPLFWKGSRSSLEHFHICFSTHTKIPVGECLAERPRSIYSLNVLIPIASSMKLE